MSLVFRGAVYKGGLVGGKIKEHKWGWYQKLGHDVLEQSGVTQQIGSTLDGKGRDNIEF